MCIHSRPCVEECHSSEEAEQQLTQQSGLLGVSGVSNDLRDIRQAADTGNADALLALDMLVHSARQWAASYLFDLGGLDTIVFTAGIGENHPWLRQAICEGLETFGVELDMHKNNICHAEKAMISTPDSKVKIMVDLNTPAQYVIDFLNVIEANNIKFICFMSRY